MRDEKRGLLITDQFFFFCCVAAGSATTQQKPVQGSLLRSQAHATYAKVITHEYGAIWRRTVTHCVSVKASIFHSAPPNRAPLPEEPTPPNGTTASSLIVW